MAKDIISEAVRQIDGSKSISGESTISTGVDNGISFGGLTKLYSFTISNDSTLSGYDITITFNGSTSWKVKAGESLEVDDFEIISVVIANASGNTVAYRYMGVGE